MINRRQLLLAGVGGAGSLLVGTPAMALSISGPGYYMKGKIYETYLKFGGQAIFGLPIGKEVHSSLYSAYYQRCEKGHIWWSSASGGRGVPFTNTVRLKGAKNFRDMAGEGDGLFKRGLIYRSNSLSLPNMERYILQTLGVKTIIKFGGSDVSVSGATRLSYPIKNLSASTIAQKQAMYRNYVNNATNQLYIGKTIKYLATATAPLVVHCSQGRDRTGWISAIVHTLMGVSAEDRMAEYMKSASPTYGTVGSVDPRYLQAALDEVEHRYGTMENHLDDCLVRLNTIDALRARLS